MSPQMRTPWVFVALITAGIIGLVSCGIATESDANRIEPEEVPFGLLDETPTTVASSGRSEQVYLVADGRLVPVERAVTVDADLPDLLQLVVDGPTDTERSLGITSAVPPGAVAAVEQRRGIASVDLAAAFGDIRTAEQPVALAQIVYTLTGQPGIGAVRFTLGGQPVEVPLANGTSQSQPLTRDDLGDFAPR